MNATRGGRLPAAVGGRIGVGDLNATVAAHGLLRLACAWCFIGHGAWGVYRKPGWLPFYHVFGIPDAAAFATMPVIGAVDIALGLLVLVYPCRAALAWMAFWCLFTALLRPLADMGWWELLERGGNYAPPIALLLVSLPQSRLGWFGKIEALADPLPPAILAAARWTLRVGIAVLLIGHGGFAAFEARPMLIEHWASLGVVLEPSALRLIGWGEIAAGVAVLATDSPALLLAITLWKVATELLHPVAGSAMDVFEWIERGGDYFAPLALIALGAAAASRKRTVASR
jgi:hypothetical protein